MNKRFFSGGKDAKVLVWSQNFELLQSYDLKNTNITLQNASIRSICENDGSLVIGTQGCEICELNCSQTESPNNQLQVKKYIEVGSLNNYLECIM